MRALVATLLLAGVGAGAVASRDGIAQQATRPIAVIEDHSRFEFTMVTRWNQVLLGRFPESEGDVLQLPDGRRQVRIRLSTATVEIVDHPRYTRYMRGPRFFDAPRFPDVTFLSDPYDAELLHTGGALHGRLRMHGIQRREQFVLSPAECVRPGRDCPIIAVGTVRRGQYDLDGWRMAMRDEVRFSMHVRLRDTADER
jgi:polyisoprenoid-binding protein YceI